MTCRCDARRCVLLYDGSRWHGDMMFYKTSKCVKYTIEDRQTRLITSLGR